MPYKSIPAKFKRVSLEVLLREGFPYAAKSDQDEYAIPLELQDGLSEFADERGWSVGFLISRFWKRNKFCRICLGSVEHPPNDPDPYYLCPVHMVEASQIKVKRLLVDGDYDSPQPTDLQWQTFATLVEFCHSHPHFRLTSTDSAEYLCPKCSTNFSANDDYLCKECRYG